VKSLLGEGGMGTVYLAEHAVMGWPAAIKVLRRSLADDKVLVKRFINEARVIRTVRHPNIVEILDIGTLPDPDDRPYLLMELLEGETLGQRLDRCGRLAVPAAIDIICQTALGLAVAHGKGITHRDLKPDNLFLVRDPDAPGRDKVKVLDFGIAKLRDREGRTASAHTRNGVLLGTPAYMSPEQCRGLSEAVDHRADIYALSVILYQMLAGKVPFTAAGSGDVLIMHVNAEAPRIGAENPAVPGFVEAAILRGMAKLREQRFQSMTELADALRAQPHETPLAPIPAASEPPSTHANPPGTAIPTPISWSGPRGSTTWSTRRPTWRTAAVGLSAAIAVLLIFVAGSVRLRRDRAVEPATPAGTPVDVTRAPTAASPSGPAATPVPAAPTRLPQRSPAPPEPARAELLPTGDSDPTPARKPVRRARSLAAPAVSPDRAEMPTKPKPRPTAPPLTPKTKHKAKPWL
jgi:eukaryotic-like serine/threonine-protein kinase